MNHLITKVRKLLTTSADAGATPAEAQTALRIAQRIMAEHRISTAEIERAARDEARAAGKVDAEDMVSEEIGRWIIRQDGWLAMAVGEACGVGIYRAWGAGGKKTMRAFGLAHDIAVAREMFGWVAEKMRADRRTFCRRYDVPAGSVEGRSFADGYAHELLASAKRDKAARMKSTDTVEVDAPGAPRALIVLGEAEQHHERALTVKAKQLGIGKGRSRAVRRDSRAYAQGKATGSEVNLSRGVVR